MSRHEAIGRRESAASYKQANGDGAKFENHQDEASPGVSASYPIGRKLLVLDVAPCSVLLMVDEGCRPRGVAFVGWILTIRHKLTLQVGSETTLNKHHSSSDNG